MEESQRTIADQDHQWKKTEAIFSKKISRQDTNPNPNPAHDHNRAAPGPDHVCGGDFLCPHTTTKSSPMLFKRLKKEGKDKPHLNSQNHLCGRKGDGKSKGLVIAITHNNSH